MSDSSVKVAPYEDAPADCGVRLDKRPMFLDLEELGTEVNIY